MQNQRIKTPSCACLGHVDVGKTMLLDYMRNSKTMEASGITQQIGATSYSKNRLEKLVGTNLATRIGIDSLMMIDTPGHECFETIRHVAIKVSDVIVLIIDMIKGLEKQTKNVIHLLQKEKTPFIICLNKMDRIYGWMQVTDDLPLNIANVLKRMDQDVRNKYNNYVEKIKMELYKYEVYSELYYLNKDPDNVIPIVPMSAKTGEGIPDLIMLISLMAEKKYLKNELIENNIVHGYILNTQYDNSLGQYHVILHRNGMINNGDQITVNGNKYVIKQLFATQENSEIKGEHKFMRTKTVEKAMGVGAIFESMDGKRIDIIEPSSLYFLSSETRIMDLSQQLDDNYEQKWQECMCKKGEPGIQIIAPSHIMMDGLLYMIKTLTQAQSQTHDEDRDKDQIKIERYKVGKIDKKDLIISSKWMHRNREKDPMIKSHMKKYSIILSFDPMVEFLEEDLIKHAESMHVKIIHSNVVYQLLQKYEDYMLELKKSLWDQDKEIGAQIKILPTCVFRSSNPIVVGVNVIEGAICVNDLVYADIEMTSLIGKIESIQKNNKIIENARMGEDICIKISTKKAIGVDIEKINEGYRTMYILKK